MSQTSYQAALPHDVLIYYIVMLFFSQEGFGGELDEVTVAVDGMGGAGELEGGEVVTNGERDFGGH